MLKNLENWLAKNKVTPENKGEVSPQKSVSKTDGRHSPKKPFNKKRAGAPSRPQRPMPRAGAGLRIFALGGMEGVGEKNMFVIEYQRKILIIDMGWAFPDDTLPGIDYIIPDITALRGRERDIVGVVFTHGHMDHIGAIPFLLPQLQYPQLFATKFTGEVIRDRLQRDFTDVFHHAKINTIDPERPLKLGPFTLDFFRVAHNIPDAVGMAISTPAGTILHTGDFKLDFVPRDGRPTDLQKMAQLGARGVDLMIFDSTGATKSGASVSEKEVGRNLDKIISEAPGRVILSTFSNLIPRHQQIVEAAERYGRKVFLVGRSMDAAFELAQKAGYLKVRPGTLQKINSLNRFKDQHVVIISTGSQGEPRSGLQRMAEGTHAQIKIKPGDTVVFSNSVVPGNERSAAWVENQMAEQGAHVIYNKLLGDIHASGHASREDLKTTFAIVKAKNLMPFHGESRMMREATDIAIELGYRPENIFRIKKTS